MKFVFLSKNPLLKKNGPSERAQICFQSEFFEKKVESIIKEKNPLKGLNLATFLKREECNLLKSPLLKGKHPVQKKKRAFARALLGCNPNLKIFWVRAFFLLKCVF